jgi:NlpC/P60 family putative phage cell wall peptidase
MVTRAQIVAEARSWIGTRYQHQMSTKGVATDCIGLVRGVCVNTGLLPAAQVDEMLAPFKGYGKQPSGELKEAMDAHAIPITKQEARPGDVALMVFGGDPTHVAILANYVYGGLSIIHSYLLARKVVESNLDKDFESKIMAYYRLPNIED